MGLWLFITFFIFHFHSNVSAARSVKQPDPRQSFPPEARSYLAWLSHVESLGSSKTTSFNELSLPDGIFADQSFVTVSQTPGAADFESIQAAINSVPKGNTRRIVIQIAPGTYREKLKIPKKKSFVTLLGAGADQTVITWDDTAAKTGTTFSSATVAVMSDAFIARGIAFENSSPRPLPGTVGGQAVAFQISGDHGAIYDCAFYGAQDTLYDHRGRHYFKNCLIQGSVDFIFGNGQSIYQGCELRTVETNLGSLTAQKRNLGSESTGFVFINCTVSGVGMVLLGRAWGSYSRVVFISSYLGAVVLPAGWNDWNILDRQKTAFYGEYKCFGPGADRHSRVAWSYELTDAEVGPFLSLNFIDANSWLTSNP